MRRGADPVARSQFNGWAGTVPAVSTLDRNIIAGGAGRSEFVAVADTAD
jgi:hypothetical protein